MKQINKITIWLCDDTILSEANDMLTDIRGKYNHLIRDCEVELDGKA